MFHMIFEKGKDVFRQQKGMLFTDGAIICGNANTESVYDSRGILFV